MEHLDINPYTPGQVCMEINSKNSEKSIMKNLFSYFNKKQQKMNNGFNKIINSQNQSNKDQRLTIYTPMIEGLVGNKRDGISSVDSASRKNFIQQNRNFIVKKTRPQTTNPNKKQNAVNQQRDQIYAFQELDKQYNSCQARKNSQSFNHSSQVAKQISYSQDRQVEDHHFQNEDQQNDSQNIKHQRTVIKKSVINQVFGQAQNNSFESIQSRKNSLNRKFNTSINNQTQQTQEALETQAGTTINLDQNRNLNSQTINSNCDKFQNTSTMNQTILESQNDQQKMNSFQLKTEESDYQSKYQKAMSNKDQLDFQHHNNSHFCSKSTNYHHTISSQNNDFLAKNIEDTTIDTLISAHVNKTQNLNKIQCQNNYGVEKISNILQKNNQNQESKLDLSIDQQVIDESYKNLLNERPPFSKKQFNRKIKVRSSGCLVEECKLPKDQTQIISQQHNSSCNQFSYQNHQIFQNGRRNQDQSTQGSLIYLSQNNEYAQNNNQNNYGQQHFKQNSQHSNNSLNQNGQYMLNQQKLEQQHSKGMISIKTQFLTQESNDKKEQYQATIEEDIQNFTTIEEKEQDNQNNSIEQVPFTLFNQDFQNQNLQKKNYQQENGQKTPQKEFETNVNSLQNSMKQIIMKSNHITFNVMSNAKDQFNNNQSNYAFINNNSQISDNKFMTSSFDGQNQMQFDLKVEDEMKAQEQFNQMKEYIQCQIDSNKQVINQYYKNNISSKKNLKQFENQDLNNSSQNLSNKQNPITEFCVNKQTPQQVLSRPISSKRPLISQRKVSIDKRFNFYDELDKKLEEKKKNILKIAMETQIQNGNTVMQNDNQILFNQGMNNKGFNSGRNKSMQVNQNQQAQKIPLSQRRKSTQETSRFNTNNLVLNESKINNYNVSEFQGNPSKMNHQMFVLKDQFKSYQNQAIEKEFSQNENTVNPIQSQIYYQQFISSNRFKENIPNLRVLDNNSQLQILQGENFISSGQQEVNYKSSRPPSNYQNQNQFKQNQKQYLSQNQQQEKNNFPIQQKQESFQNKINQNQKETHEFGYHISTHSRISRKQRANTMENSFEINQKKQISNIHPYSSERQSIQNTGRNSLASGKAKLSREEQLQIIKDVQIQSQNKFKLHQYLQQNKQMHQQMKIFSETMNKNNISANQSIQNQLSSSINNFSTNQLNNLGNTQQTMSMEANNYIQSSLKKSINELTNLQNTQEFLQSMKLANNTQNSFREDLNSSQINHNFYQKQAQSSTRKQNPLLYSDQSVLNRNTVAPFTELNTENQNNQQFNPKISQNMRDEQNEFLKMNEVRNSYNVQAQVAPLKSSIELNQNNVQFYENLNQNTISQEMELDQKVYANHQYKYVLKRQQRRDDPQVLQKLDQNNQNIYTKSINQWTQSKQIINKHQQNTLELQNNIQQQSQNVRNKNQTLKQQQQITQNQGNIFIQNRQINLNQIDKENISLIYNQPNIFNNQNYDDEYIQSNKGRQTNSKTSQRYHIQLNEDFEEKTLEYSGSKAGIENIF